MVDLIDRLRDYGAKFSQIDPEHLMCIEAAVEIERLRAAQQDGAREAEHFGWLKLYAEGMTVDNWRDMKARILRQLAEMCGDEQGS